MGLPLQLGQRHLRTLLLRSAAMATAQQENTDHERNAVTPEVAGFYISRSRGTRVNMGAPVKSACTLQIVATGWYLLLCICISCAIRLRPCIQHGMVLLPISFSAGCVDSRPSREGSCAGACMGTRYPLKVATISSCRNRERVNWSLWSTFAVLRTRAHGSAHPQRLSVTSSMHACMRQVCTVLSALAYCHDRAWYKSAHERV